MRSSKSAFENLTNKATVAQFENDKLTNKLSSKEHKVEATTVNAMNENKMMKLENIRLKKVSGSRPSRLAEHPHPHPHTPTSKLTHSICIRTFFARRRSNSKH